MTNIQCTQESETKLILIYFVVYALLNTCICQCSRCSLFVTCNAMELIAEWTPWRHNQHFVNKTNAFAFIRAYYFVRSFVRSILLVCNASSPIYNSINDVLNFLFHFKQQKPQKTINFEQCSSTSTVGMNVLLFFQITDFVSIGVCYRDVHAWNNVQNINQINFESFTVLFSCF